MSQKRLFVGISCLGQHQRDEFPLMNFGSMFFAEGVNWVHPENYHLTLKFLGDVDTNQERKLHNNLSKIKALSFELQMDGTEYLYNMYLAILADLSPELASLQRQVEGACLGIGQSHDYPYFIPHVAVGKIKEPSVKDLETWRSHEFQRKYLVTEIHVYESIRLNGKTEYRILESYPLERGDI